MSPHTAPPQHRAKRPFQPAITSYFHADNDDNDSDHHRGGPRLRTIPQAKPPHTTLAPQVPDSVQSSLLSVGMRVRKSVPEGYKTPKTMPPHTNQSAAQTPLRKPHTAYRDTHPSLEIPIDPSAASLQHQRELLPFCGLNKIGGYAEQPTATFSTTTTTSTYSNTDTFHPHPFTQPFSSQDSGYSSDPARSGKRSWSDDETPATHSRGNFLFTIPAQLQGEEDVPVSPLSASPPPSVPQRTLAQPRRRRGQVMSDVDVDGDGDVDMEVEMGAHAGRLAAGHASDFEEADFLEGEGGMRV